MLDKESVVVLYSNCIIVKGACQSTICDIQKNQYMVIPNDYCEVLEYIQHKKIGDIILYYKKEHNTDITQFLQYFRDKDFLLFTRNPERFPKLNLEWNEPSYITNAIFDIDELDYLQPKFKVIVDDLEKLGCKNIQIRGYSVLDLRYFEKILIQTENTRILSVELILKFYENLSIEKLTLFLRNFKRVFVIVVHSASIDNNFEVNNQKVIYTKQVIVGDEDCGMIDPGLFSINIKTFTESQKYNTCLNRKISIDSKGEIKTCPSMKKSFGNILNISLKEAMKQKGFDDLWYISKEQIEVCKDCEFRHICTDCRVYIKDPKNQYSQPLKCNYNPYIAKWKGEDGFISVEEGKTKNSFKELQ